jgi:hypothetical protein
MIVRSSLPPAHPTPSDEPTCFNLCCVVILLIGMVSLSLCIYLVLSSQSADDTNGGGLDSPALLVRKFNI